MAKTVAALYDDFDAAQSATRDLVDNGFNRNDISIAVNNVSGDYDRYVAETDVNVVTDATMTGAGAGAVLGGLGGLAVSLGAFLIPGVGPIIAAGPLLNALVSAGVGAGVGALAGGLIGTLVDLGIPANEAEYYAEGIRRGGTLVTANVANEMAGRVKDILDRHHPITLEERVNEWRESGWNHFDPDADFETDFDEPIWTRDTDLNGIDFRPHYMSNYAGKGYSYNEYAPAYRFGSTLARNPQYTSRGWLEIEPAARRHWEENYADSPWESFKDAVRHGWEGVKDAVGVR